MKGVRASIVGEQELCFETFSVPEEPKPTEIVVQMERTIISAGTELANYTGLEADTRVKGAWCEYPWTPGYGGVGRVLAVGQAITDRHPGERVYGFFPHATHTVVDTSWQMCVPVPKDLAPTIAVMGRMCGVAITAYRRAHTALDKTVVVFGLGLVGNLAGQFFAQAGMRVIGLDISTQRRLLASQTGFDETVNPTNPSEEELQKDILRCCAGKQPDIVVDAVGDSRIIERAVHLVANNGQVIMLGTPRAPYQTDSTSLLKHAHFHGVELVGALEWTVPLLKRQSPGVTTEANTELIFRMLADGSLQVMPLCSHILPPSELNTAYQGLLHQKDAYLGVVLDWENNPAPVSCRASTK